MQNWLKSVFISLYVTALVIVSGHAAWALWTTGLSGGWIGVAISAWAWLVFFVYLFTVRVARTSEELLGWRVMTWIGLVFVCLFGYGQPDFSVQILYVFGVGVLGSHLYVFWYSRLGRSSSTQLVVGARLPAFDLQDESEQPVASGSWVGKPTLVLFYRGNWCPLCMAQIKEVAAQYQQLDALGVRVVLVSPQPHANTRSLAAKFNVPFVFLVDAGNRAARQLGIEARQGTPKGMEVLGYDNDTVMPTVLITDAQGTLVFADLTDNYRVRPEPEDFLKVLNDLEVVVGQRV